MAYVAMIMTECVLFFIMFKLFNGEPVKTIYFTVFLGLISYPIWLKFFKLFKGESNND